MAKKKHVLHFAFIVTCLVTAIFYAYFSGFLAELLPRRNTRAAGNTTLANIQTAMGGQIIYTGAETNLDFNQVSAGTYTIHSRLFPCSYGPTCEPDRYEIRFPSVITPIYGLGMQASVNRVELNDFLDTSFSSGHLTEPQDIYNGDIGRMRTPVFVLPRQNVIIAYLQPATKMLRLTRNGTNGCPANNTCIVLKKTHLISEGSLGKLLIIKGNSPADMYSKYYAYLKNNNGNYFKKPHWNAFGLFFETYNEFQIKAPTIGGATVEGLQNVINQYTSKGLKLSALVFGSGYWQSNESYACSLDNADFLGLYRIPTIDSLTIKEPGLKTFFSSIHAQGTYPIIGMRYHASTNTGNALSASGMTGEQFLASQLQVSSLVQPFFYNNNFYYETGAGVRPPVKLINVDSPTVMNRYIDLTQNAYGPFRGIKEDEMLLGYTQRHNPSGYNLPDGTVSKTYKYWADRYVNDFLIFGRNDWFGVGTDLQSSQGYLLPAPPSTMYDLKYFLDSSLNQVFSGYPHPKIESTTERLQYTGTSAGTDCSNFCGKGWNHSTALSQYNTYCKIPAMSAKEYLRTFMLHVFSPGAIESHGFWHLQNAADINTYVSFAKLRMRLHQYSYDQAQKWYATGVPHLMQPLYINYPTDNNVYNLYKTPANPTVAANQYMFGNALLVRPLYSDADSVSVYLPAGSWKPFLKTAPVQTTGMHTYSVAAGDYPVYAKEGEIIILAEENDMNRLGAHVFFNTATSSSVYTLYKKAGGTARLQAFKNGAVVTVRNLDTLNQVSATLQASGFYKADITTLLTLPAATMTPTVTPIPPTATFTPTRTPVPPTATFTPTRTPVPPTATFTPTRTPVPPTATFTPTRTPVPPTATFTPTRTPVPPTATFTPTPIPVPPTTTFSPTQVPTVFATATGAPTMTQIPTIIATSSPTAVASATLTPTQQPTIVNYQCPRHTAGNANCDEAGIVNTVDYACWRHEMIYGTWAAGCYTSDFDRIGGVNILDYVIWYQTFTAEQQ